MKLIGVDFETTGLSPDHDRVIEIGAVLWDTDRNSPVQITSHLIKHPEDENVQVSEEVQEVTGILPEDIELAGIDSQSAFDELNEMMLKAEHVVAHNGNEFDRLFYLAEMERLKCDPVSLPWIDTITDVPYPSSIHTRKLSYLAADHGQLNPFPHRAVFDVLTMLRLLAAYDIGEVVQLSKSPTIKIKAEVSYEDREKAKALGYRWNPRERMWAKSVKEFLLDSEKARAEFNVVRI